MIRRSITLQDGRPGWLLIPQRNHAQLAGELAGGWISLPELVPPDDCPDLLTAIARHDDGWNSWDQHWYQHTVDGVPISFHEMDPADSNRIWDQSIQLTLSQRPLVTYIVARHFIRMRERSSSDDPTGSSEAFIDRNERVCQQSFEAWKAARRPTRSEIERVELAVDGLQFFDNLSLILCLGKLSASIELTPPVPPAFSLEFEEPWRIRFSPNPIKRSPVQLLATEAFEVPDCGLDAKDLKRAAVTRTLTWQMTD